MFGLEDSRRYYVCQHYVRMNMGINGLSRIVSNELRHPPLCLQFRRGRLPEVFELSGVLGFPA